MKRIIILLLGFWVLGMACTGSAQIQRAWVARYDGGLSLSTNEPVTMNLDSAGNIIIAGHGTGSNGDWDYLTLKYSSHGSLLWARRYADPGITNDLVRKMALDETGNVYLTGTSKTVKYSAAGLQNYIAPYAGRDIAIDTNGNAYVTGFSEVDFATVKLDSMGSNVWLRVYDIHGLNQSDRSDLIALDGTGGLYIAGMATCCGTVPITRAFTISCIKYDIDGGFLWESNPFNAQPFLSVPELEAIRVSQSEYFIYTGNLLKSPTYITHKLALNGSVIGGYTWNGGYELNRVRGMKIGNSHSVYLAGTIFGGDLGDPNRYLPVIGTIKLDANLNQLWLHRYGSISALGNDIDLDAQENVYVAGYAPVPGSQPHMPLTNDMVTIKYDPDGNEQWVQRYRGTFPGNSAATAIAVDPASGAVYVAGYSQSSPTLTELVLIKYAELENIRMLENGQVELQFFDMPGQLCQFQATANFPDWEDIGTGLTGPDGVCRFIDTNAPAFPYRFYRRVTP